MIDSGMEITGKGNLVLYKAKPAVIRQTGAKVTIELETGKTVSVRPKDITLLHPGPIQNLKELSSAPAASSELEAACEMLYGEQTNIQEFSELAYEAWTPSSAWEVIGLLGDGLLLSGEPWEITVHTEEVIAQERERRQLKAAQQQQWESFIERLRTKKLEADDTARFFDVENLAQGHTTSSRILKELGIKEDAEHAHAVLLKYGIWDDHVNPHIARFGCTTEPDHPLSEIAGSIERVDLTHLSSFAIDDEGNTDPDDAISIDGDRIWVHVADVASAVSPGSPADLSAASQGATLYLPEITVPMLHRESADLFGLGLQELSPALSFGVLLDDEGHIHDVQICRSTVRVTRITYEQAQQTVTSSPLKEIDELLARYQQGRKDFGAIELSLPEVRIRVREDHQVEISPIVTYPSRELVSNAMIMAGEAAAQFASSHQIPFPYAVQIPPEGSLPEQASLTQMYAFRRQLKPSEVRLSPDVHSGLGVAAYSRVTSPLRRYVDLLAHQQLGAYLSGEPMMDDQELLYKASTAFEQAKQTQRLERAANYQWKLVYLKQHPDWEGTGVVVEIRKNTCTVLIPSLAMETQLPLIHGIEIGDQVILSVESVQIPYQSAQFAVRLP